MELKREKMKQLIHYIINTCHCKDNFGKTVLFKLLYFSDFDFFEVNEKSITNETYLKYPKGPVPAHFEELKDELVNEKVIKEYEEPVFYGSQYMKYTYISLKNPKTDLLSDDEKTTINNVIEKLSHMNANSISQYSHDDIPWRATEDYEPLEYELVFYRNSPYSMIPHDN